MMTVSENSFSRDCSRPAHFSTDEGAERFRESCDYSTKIDLEDAKKGKTPRQVRVYADGVYDMFHSGHARQLMQIHTLIPNAYLIVGVTNDKLTIKRKGRPVMNEKERYEAVRHCRYVDEVHKDAPWILDMDFIEKNKIDLVAHDAIPYTHKDGDDVYDLIKNKGMFLETQRTEGISTTDVIARIIRDYDIYLKRNLERGVSRKELNISYYKEARLRFSDNIESVSSKIRNAIDFLEGKSHQLAATFLRRFASDGRLLPSFLQLDFNNVRGSPNNSDTNDLSDEEISPSDRSSTEKRLVGGQGEGKPSNRI